MSRYFYPYEKAFGFLEIIKAAKDKYKYSIAEIMKRTGMNRYRVNRILKGKITPLDIYELDFVLGTHMFK